MWGTPHSSRMISTGARRSATLRRPSGGGTGRRMRRRTATAAPSAPAAAATGNASHSTRGRRSDGFLEVIEAILDAPATAARRVGADEQARLRPAERCATGGAGEESVRRRDRGAVDVAAANENARRQLPPRAGALDGAIQPDQPAGGHSPFERRESEMGGGQHLAGGKPGTVQLLPDPGGVEVEVEGYELHRLLVERRPGLPAQTVADHGLEVVLACELQDVGGLWLGHAAQFAEKRWSVGRVVKRPHLYQGVEQPGDERHF